LSGAAIAGESGSSAQPDTIPGTQSAFVYGTQLDPPFVLDRSGDVLFLNGVQVFPSQQGSGASEPTADEVAIHALNLAADRAADAEVDSIAKDEARLAVYRASPLVRAVRRDADGAVRVEWAANGAPKIGAIVRRGPSTPVPTGGNSVLDQFADRLKKHLQDGRLVIFDETGPHFFSARGSAEARRQICRAFAIGADTVRGPVPRDLLKKILANRPAGCGARP
jgi:hypothetical protein